MNCPDCGGKVLSEQEWDELEKWIAADQKFDAGEFSGSHDYYEGLCFCGRDDAMEKDPLF